jgi:uncharacterized protein YunC (DUF1805 family)
MADLAKAGRVATKVGGKPLARGKPSAGSKAPPPKTTPGSSATKAQQDCPLKVEKPCDVNKLALKVIGRDDDGTRTLELSTTSVLRTLPVYCKDRHVLALLKAYDIIIDCIAEPLFITKPDAKAAVVEGRGYYHGRKCPTQSHALLTMTHLKTRVVTEKKQPGASELALPPTKFFAASSYIDNALNRKGPLDIAASVFGIIKSFLESISGNVTEIEVRAEGCGVRAIGDSQPKNLRLMGLVRVFRKSKWTIGIKIPPLGNYSDERKASIDVHGIKSSSKEKEGSVGFDYYKNKTTSTSSGEGVTQNYKHTGETQVGGRVESYEQSRNVKDGSVTTKFEEQYSKKDGRTITNKDGQFTTDEIKKRLSREHGFDLVISHNNTEVEVGDTIKKLREHIANICKVITDISRIFNKLPQIGWKFSFEVSVFAGQIIVECAPQYLGAVALFGRYHGVQHRFKGSIDVEIINLSIKVSFGVDARALDSGLVLKIEGTLSIKASVSKEINLDFFSPKQVVDVGADGKAKLAAIGYVSLLGKTIADAEISVSTGIELKGNLTVEVSTRTFDLKGKLNSKPIILTGYIVVPYWFDKKIDPPVKILEGSNLYTFT